MKRTCSICCVSCDFTPAFPYSTTFLDVDFKFEKCNNCDTVSITEPPSHNALRDMYSENYSRTIRSEGFMADDSHPAAVFLFSQHLKKNSLWLDYGCGNGEFLKTLLNREASTVGVEYSKKTVEFVCRELLSHCHSNNLDNRFRIIDTEFLDGSKLFYRTFDVIHLADVLEHVPEPLDLIRKLLPLIKENGSILIQSPLEEGRSLQNWIIKLNGFIKYNYGAYCENFPPYHLHRFNLSSLNYIASNSELVLKKICLYESGWPYAERGGVRRLISLISIILQRFMPKGLSFGNRAVIEFIRKER